MAPGRRGGLVGVDGGTAPLGTVEGSPVSSKTARRFLELFFDLVFNPTRSTRVSQAAGRGRHLRTSDRP